MTDSADLRKQILIIRQESRHKFIKDTQAIREEQGVLMKNNNP